MSTPHVVVVMGVAGTGKTTIGPLLADALGVPYAEGVGEQGADRGLAGPCYAHHHDDVGGAHCCLAVFIDIGPRHRSVALLKPITYDLFKRL